eukprot:s1728_g14.t1
MTVRIFYSKRELKFAEDGIQVRYIPKLADLVQVSDRRGKTIPPPGCLELHDPENTAPGEYLNAEELPRSSARLWVYFMVFDMGILRRAMQPIFNEIKSLFAGSWMAILFGEDMEEEKNVDEDEILSEGDEEAPTVTPVPGVDRSDLVRKL